MITNAREEISNQVMEGVNYIRLPSTISDSTVTELEAKLVTWLDLAVEMHVLDFKTTSLAVPPFYKAVQRFADKLKSRNMNLVSVNMNDTIAQESKKQGADGAFNRILNFPGDLYTKKKLTDTELRRLLFKYIARAAFTAVEVSLQSTCACDENYSAKPEDVPLDQFDMITLISVNNEFLHAEFRLCSSIKVLERLARAMLGEATPIDQELMESMAMELLNMIYGHAKSNLNDKESFSLPPAIPRLLRKSDFHRVKRSGAAQVTIMPMVTPMGSFYVEVDFGKNRAG